MTETIQQAYFFGVRTEIKEGRLTQNIEYPITSPDGNEIREDYVKLITQTAEEHREIIVRDNLKTLEFKLTLKQEK